MVICFLVIINVITFIMFGADKRRARLQKYRISENKLICISALGGSLGGTMGMIIFRHKTRKIRFLILLPALLVFHCGIIMYLLNV